MEAPRLERRDKIVAGIVLMALGGAIEYARRDGRYVHARNYPGGSFIIDVLKDTKERSIRISGALLSLNPLKLEVDDSEHSDADLDEVEAVFDNTTASE